MSNKLTTALTNLKDGVVKHSPEILTGIGIAGMVTTTVLAVKATPKALALIEEEKKLRKIDRDRGVPEVYASEKITALDTIKITWKCYIPAAVTCVASMACLIGASSVNLRRNAALATAYKLSETALTEYKEKVVETIGEKKEKAIKDALAKDRVEETPVASSNVIMTGNGETLCLDYYTKRHFRSDIDKIKKAVNELNRTMTYDHYVSLNDYYNKIGLDGVPHGDTMGWNLDMGLLDIYPSAQLDESGTPCLVIAFSIDPKFGFDRFL